MKSEFWVIEAVPNKKSQQSCVEILRQELSKFEQKNPNYKIISMCQSSIQKDGETHIVLTICYE